MWLIFRGNLHHFPSTQNEEEKEKLEGDQRTRQHQEPVMPSSPDKKPASPASQQMAPQGLSSLQGEAMETDVLKGQKEGWTINQEKPSKALLERPSQNDVGIQTVECSLWVPETVSAATQTVKNVCEQGTSTVDQKSGKQDAAVQTEKGAGEKPISAPGDDTESLHSQVRELTGYHRALLSTRWIPGEFKLWYIYLMIILNSLIQTKRQKQSVQDRGRVMKSMGSYHQ